MSNNQISATSERPKTRKASITVLTTPSVFGTYLLALGGMTVVSMKKLSKFTSFIW